MSARQSAFSLAARSIQLVNGRSSIFGPLVGRINATQAASGPSTAGASFRFLRSFKSPAASPMWLRRGYSASTLPPHTLMAMPSLSPTMTQGNIASWTKAEGDSVAPGDVLAEVETDKANMEWEAQEEGFIAKILYPAGSKDIEVGTPVAVLVEDEDAIAAFKDYAPGGAEPAASAPAPTSTPPPAAPAPPPTPAAASAFPPHTVLSMPSLSPTMNEGNILEWNKKVGEAVAPGDLLCDVETDKATIGWEAQSEEGYLAKILVEGGTNGISVGAPVAIIVEDEASVEAFANFTVADVGGAPAPAAEAEAVPTPAPTPAPTPSAAAAAPAAPSTPPSTPGRVSASPYAKKLAAEAGVNLASIQGSGPGGRIVAADIANAPAAPVSTPAAAAAPAPPSAPRVTGEGYVDTPHSQIRRITAQRLLESKQTVPHYYLTAEAQMDKLLKLRTEVNEALSVSSPGTKVSVNDLIIKAAAVALKKVPGVNASWHEQYTRQYDYVDISVAVQTPIGLMVPIVKDADTKSLADISADVRRLAAKAKEGKLQPSEFTGGTFTISNLGMMGVTHFCAIINPPQAAILAVGATQKRVVLGAGGAPTEVATLTATLSCDHRVVDGAMGAEWLAAFRSALENPLTLLL